MTLSDFLATTTGGVRSAVTLLGAMVVYVALHMPKVEDREELYRQRTGLIFAVACVTFSPVHAAALLQHPLPPAVPRMLDLVASSLACVALIYMLAARALQRGVPMYRVRRAMASNASIIFGFVAAAWLIR